LDNFLYVLSIGDSRERVIDRIKLVSKTQYDSFEIIEHHFSTSEKIIVILSSKGNIFKIVLRENFKFESITEVKFDKFKLNVKAGGRIIC